MGAQPAEEEHAAGKGKRETWRDWLPPDAAQALLGPRADKSLLITRAELLERLGGTVTERELRYWESAGALPAAVRQFHRGAMHAVYPVWYVDLVSNVRDRRKEKVPLHELREYARDLFTDFARHLTEWRPEWGPPLPHPLREELERFMRELSAKHGIHVDAAEIRLRAGPGRRLRWSFPVFAGATTLGYYTFHDTADSDPARGE